MPTRWRSGTWPLWSGRRKSTIGPPCGAWSPTPPSMAMHGPDGRAEHDAGDDPQRVGGGEGDGPLGDAERTPSPAPPRPDSRSGLGPQRLGGSAWPRPSPIGGTQMAAATAPITCVVRAGLLCDQPRGEEERRLVDRPAHVERDHGSPAISGRTAPRCPCSSDASQRCSDAVHGVGDGDARSPSGSAIADHRRAETTGMIRIGMIGPHELGQLQLLQRQWTDVAGDQAGRRARQGSRR